jgi:glucokinase
VRRYLAGRQVSVDCASFGVAGPVIAGRATVTNLPWQMSEAGLARALSIPRVSVLNDLAAIARAIPLLQSDDLVTLCMGEADPTGNLAVIAPGTGLGEAFLTWDEDHYRSHASEGGHTNFAASTLQQSQLLRYLAALYDRVSVERVCSGSGIPNIYAFLRDSGYAAEPPWLRTRLANAEDQTPIIVGAALLEPEPVALAAEALRLFSSVLGAEAGDLALTVLATGGVYLGGGIPPRILSVLTAGDFVAAFRDKGRLSTLLEKIPVHVIRHPQVALIGAARHALEGPCDA